MGLTATDNAVWWFFFHLYVSMFAKVENIKTLSIYNFILKNIF